MLFRDENKHINNEYLKLGEYMWSTTSNLKKYGLFAKGLRN